MNHLTSYQRPTLPAVVLRQFGNSTRKTVDARQLHRFLSNRDDFSKWIRDRIAQYGFWLDEDYQTFRENPRKGRPRIDYILTLDMAKELCMVERNDRGKQARQYFIECEKKFREVAAAAQHPEPSHVIPQTLHEALRLAADLAERNASLEAKTEADKPKVEFHDAVTKAENCHSMLEAAKILQTGRRRLFKRLRDDRILSLENVPYQQYIEKDYFKVIEKTYTDRWGTSHLSARTLVTGKGMTFLQRHLSGKEATA